MYREIKDVQHIQEMVYTQIKISGKTIRIGLEHAREGRAEWRGCIVSRQTIWLFGDRA